MINIEEKKKIRMYQTLSRYKKDLELKGYEVVYISLYGSQNYNLDDGQSDIDARAVVLPTIKQLLNNGTVSKTYDFDTGQVDVKDVITFMKVLGKGNLAYIESIDTEINLGDKGFKELLKDFDINPRSLVGMMHEKLKALEKGLATNAPTLETLGYDAKQIHHIFRLHDLLTKEELKSFYTYSNKERDTMLKIKRLGNGSLEEVTEQAQSIIADSLLLIKDIAFNVKPVSEEVYQYVEHKMVEALFKPQTHLSAQQVRTFGGNVPKKHKEMFPALQNRDGEDFSYTVYSYLEEW